MVVVAALSRASTRHSTAGVCAAWNIRLGLPRVAKSFARINAGVGGDASASATLTTRSNPGLMRSSIGQQRSILARVAIPSPRGETAQAVDRFLRGEVSETFRGPPACSYVGLVMKVVFGVLKVVSYILSLDNSQDCRLDFLRICD